MAYVYIANAFDSMTAETEEGMTISQIRKLDPTFVKEEWAEEVKLNLVPKLLKAHFLVCLNNSLY